MKVGFIGFGIMGWPQGMFLLRLGSAIGPNALHHPPRRLMANSLQPLSFMRGQTCAHSIAATACMAACMAFRPSTRASSQWVLLQHQ